MWIKIGKLIFYFSLRVSRTKKNPYILLVFQHPLPLHIYAFALFSSALSFLSVARSLAVCSKQLIIIIIILYLIWLKNMYKVFYGLECVHRHKHTYKKRKADCQRKESTKRKPTQIHISRICPCNHLMMSVVSYIGCSYFQ